MSTTRAIASVAVLALLCAAGGHAQEKKVVMTAVKYAGLKQEILKQRGKVVIVDFWAHNCPPCRKAFPHFLEMHRKYAGKGLVVITVALEDRTIENAIPSGNKFLSDINSPFRNLLLDEPQDVWTKQFAYASLPFYYVFDRQGRWVRYRAADYSPKPVPYDELEKVVVKMLAEK